MGISTARRIAYEVLHRVEADGAYASEVLHAELNGNVKAADAALATELSLGVLRRRRLLDFLLQGKLKKPVEKLDLPVAIALRMGMYQLRFLERIPARAAVNESVEMVRRAKKASAAPLVNVVLRLMAEGAQLTEEEWLPEEASLAEELGILHSHPTWLVERWLERWGEKSTLEILEANNRTPSLSCALSGAAGREEVWKSMESEGLEVEPGRLMTDAITVRGGSAVRSEAFRKGWISVQDEASQAVPLLLGAKAGERVLDVCAAPGGKTAALERAVRPGGMVVAVDRHVHRLRAMREQMERLGMQGVALLAADGSCVLPLGVKFSKILVDAPCSGTGTLGRHPEIRWRLRPEHLGELRVLQAKLLKNAAALLEHGGRLVYSTCSMEPEENEEVVNEVLNENGELRRIWRTEAARGLERHVVAGVGAQELFDEEGNFRTMPGERGTDGFFAAVVEKP
jgi:16S rRNA (cytosine967-C5)-methyltransferase